MSLISYRLCGIQNFKLESISHLHFMHFLHECHYHNLSLELVLCATRNALCPMRFPTFTTSQLPIFPAPLNYTKERSEAYLTGVTFCLFSLPSLTHPLIPSISQLPSLRYSPCALSINPSKRAFLGILPPPTFSKYTV